MATNFRLTNEKTGNQVEFNFDEGGSPIPTPSDASNSIVTFTQASTRTNITTGEKLSVICGKIKKFFADLKTVAFTGSYNDLSDTPTIPTVNNATLTIKQGETTKGTFTANASTDVTITLDEGGGGGSLPMNDYTFLITSASDVINASASSFDNYTELESHNPVISVNDYGTVWMALNQILNLYNNVLEAYSEIGNITAINQEYMYTDNTHTTKYSMTWFTLGTTNNMLLQVLIVNVNDTMKVYLCDGFSTGGMTYDDINVHIKQLSTITITDNRNN